MFVPATPRARAGFASLALTITAAVAVAGPLTPPPGPVAPTQKTLQQVEPRTPVSAETTPGNENAVFIITQPGSYYLTANVVGASGKDGVRILADHVTLDLNGFTLQGVPGSGSGVTSDGLADNITIRDGVVIGWGVSGVDLMANAGFAAGAIVEHVQSISNGNRGISVGTDAIIRACIARGNGADGIRARSFTGSLGHAVIESCEASSNGSVGILAAAGSVVLNCVATSNLGGGIAVLSDSLVSGCVARSNQPFGVSLSARSSAMGCTVTGTFAGSGIIAAGGGVVSNNTCAANSGGAGVRITGTRARVERNHCTNNATGILVESSDSLIIANTCGANGVNWNIAPNNHFGPILNMTGAANFGVNGDAAAGNLPTTDPLANFTY